jgi:hypothetical protein
MGFHSYEIIRISIPFGRLGWPCGLGMGLRLFACWIAGSNPAGDYRYLSLLSVVCCQVEASATGRSLIQRSPTERVCVTECDQEQQ